MRLSSLITGVGLKYSVASSLTRGGGFYKANNRSLLRILKERYQDYISDAMMNEGGLCFIRSSRLFPPFIQTTSFLKNTDRNSFSVFDSDRLCTIPSRLYHSSPSSYLTTDVPLIFVPGMKGSHLSIDADIIDTKKLNSSEEKQQEQSSLQLSLQQIYSQFKDKVTSPSKTQSSNKKRVWLTLSGLLNFPPKPDNHPDRSLDLPLSYTNGVQDYGRLKSDGVVDHIIEFGDIAYGRGGEGGQLTGENNNFAEFFPFYGHVTKELQLMDLRYHQQKQDQLDVMTTEKDVTNDFSEQNSTASTMARPTAVFEYDWRRSLPELTHDFHQFCHETFPNQPVQILAHSMGGLLAWGALQKYDTDAKQSKYAPGIVCVGVPFRTGIQYLQDLHKGYFTELERCRQFTPPSQFTFSSHWTFFPLPTNKLRGKNSCQDNDAFVDVTEHEEDMKVPFVPDVSSIGKDVSDPNLEFRKAIKGRMVDLDFYNLDDWEKNELGIFDPYYRNTVIGDEMMMEKYKEHMRIQLKSAKEWRENVLCEYRKTNRADNNDKHEHFPPPIVACATNTVSTVNQILRRKRSLMSNSGTEQTPFSTWEYDYVSGRYVPGDGRIDYEKAFPEGDIPIKKVALKSPHAKQMCWEVNGGSFGTILDEVTSQIQTYEHSAAARGKEENCHAKDLIKIAD